jgi:hypothetical protein
MSQKKHKQLRRDGKDRKTTNCSKYENCNLSKLRLVSRDQLLSILKWLKEKWIIKRVFQEPGHFDPNFDSYSHPKTNKNANLDEKLQSIFSESNTGNKSSAVGLYYYVKNLKPLHSARTNRFVVPVSLYHDKNTGECLYQVWTVEDYTSYVTGARVITQETAHLPKELRTYTKLKIAPQRTPVAGGVNTVLLSIDSISQLEEHLPSSGVTLDDLIWLGHHHEEFSPLTYDEMQKLLSSIPQNKLSQLYDVNDGKVRVRCITCSDGSVFYQPEKSRYAWNLTLMSVPIEFTEDPTIARVPVYRSEYMTRI